MKTIEKLYNYHMLVLVDEDENGNDMIITGDALKARLYGMGFTVPALEDYVKIPLPASDLDGDGHITNYEMQQWLIIARPILDENARRLQEYFDQFTEYSQFLKHGAGLKFARLVKIRDGKNTYREYRIDVKMAYGYRQASERLIGKFSKGELWAVREDKWVKISPIEFICYERFG